MSTWRASALSIAGATLGLALSGCSAGLPGGTQAPDPGGGKVPFPQGAAAKSYGFSDSAFSAPGSYNPGGLGAGETIRLARAAGANSTRLVLQWRLAEPVEGQWNAGYVAKLASVAKGFSRPAVITLAFAPAWANAAVAARCPRGFDCRLPPAPGMLMAWKRFVQRAVEAFPGAAFEVWNEPNVAGFWFPRIDPKAYAALVKATSDAVRATGHPARVLAGALAQAPDSGARTRLPWNFLQDLYDAGLRGTYDAISWHVYAYQHDNDVEPLGANSSFARDWQLMRQTVRKNDPGKRFWITESGVTRSGTGTSLPAGKQSTVLISLVRRELGMRDVDGVFVHTLFHWAIFPSGGREAGFGLVEAPAPGRRRPTPAYCALVKAAHGATPLCR